MGRPRKFKSAAELAEKWEEYKKFCDNQSYSVSKISKKSERVIRRKITKRISYTIEGFCAWAGITRSAFYSTYGEGTRFSDISTRMREECEFDVRRKFETGELPSSLAALWMSKYGYGIKDKDEREDGPGVVVLAEPVPLGPPPEEQEDGPA